MKELKIVSEILKNKDASESLSLLAEKFAGAVIFSSSLGLEDQIITDMIFRKNLGIEIFSIDTGRLFPETELLLQKTNDFYGRKIRVYQPDSQMVTKLVAAKGSHSFYDSVENRKECCFIRKVEPLYRALAGFKIWITGIRAEQSVARNVVDTLEWDEHRKIIKFHPLIFWNLQKVKTYISDHNIPYNPMHDRGFPSVGCEPCTRAIKDGEEGRAGRWWWEQNENKECGLHIHNKK